MRTEKIVKNYLVGDQRLTHWNIVSCYDEGKIRNLFTRNFFYNTAEHSFMWKLCCAGKNFSRFSPKLWNTEVADVENIFLVFNAAT